MKIMSVNSGSSSLKFQLLEMPEETVICSGVIERIGISGAVFTIKIAEQKQVIQPEEGIKNHMVASEMLIDALVKNKIIKSFDEIKGVGHRIVQGADLFQDSAIITDEVYDKIDSVKNLAPLHNPAHLVCIDAMRKVLPNACHVAVFDTSFHQTMKPEAYMYATPYEWYSENRIRKYGAHGTSHKYVANICAKLLNKDIKDTKIITCHIGNGASLCAVDGGVCKDTSMGLTPLAGVPMGTRCGDVDASVFDFIHRQKGYSIAEINEIMNKKSGYLGISGISSDSRDLLAAANKGNKRARLALDMQNKRIADYIGSYYVYMGGADAIVFTAGIGENSIDMRKDVMNRLACLGVICDEKANNVRGETREISTADSKIKCFVIPTNEEVAIARDVVRLMK